MKSHFEILEKDIDIYTQEARDLVSKLNKEDIFFLLSGAFHLYNVNPAFHEIAKILASIQNGVKVYNNSAMARITLCELFSKVASENFMKIIKPSLTTSVDSLLIKNIPYEECTFYAIYWIFKFNPSCHSLIIENSDLNYENQTDLIELIEKLAIKDLSIIRSNSENDSTCVNDFLKKFIKTRIPSFFESLTLKGFEIYKQNIKDLAEFLAKNTTLKSLRLMDTPIDVDMNHMDLLCNSLSHNYIILDFSVNDTSNPQIDIFLNRNKSLFNLTSDLEQIAKEIENLYEFPVNTEASNPDLLIQKKLIVEKVIIMFANLSTLKELIKSTNPNLANLTSISKITAFEDNLKQIIRNLSANLHGDVAVECWLASPYGEEANIEAFYCAYNNYKTQQDSESAFIDALPCCLNEDGFIITFNQDNQYILDSCLLSAVGMNSASHKEIRSLSTKTRELLFKYILLLSLKSFLLISNPYIPNNQGFFIQAKQQGMLEILEKLPKKLNTFDDIKLLTTLFDSKNKNNMWEKFMSRIDASTFENENLKILAEGINKLTASHQDNLKCI